MRSPSAPKSFILCFAAQIVCAVVQFHWYASSDAMHAECECGKSACFWQVVKLLSLYVCVCGCVCVSYEQCVPDGSMTHFKSLFSLFWILWTLVRCLFVCVFSLRCQCLVCLTYVECGKLLPNRSLQKQKKKNDNKPSFHPWIWTDIVAFIVCTLKSFLVHSSESETRREEKKR